VLAVTRMPAGSDVTYYAGSGWDRSGDFKTVEDWDRYLDEACSVSGRRSSSRWPRSEPGARGRIAVAT